MFRAQSALRTTPGFSLLFIPLVLLAIPALGLELEDPENFVIKRSWTDDDLGIEGPEGLFFSRGGDTLYVHSRELRPRDSALYSLDVIRDPATNEITSLENPELVYNGKFREQPSAGWAYGPEGTLFYTYGWSPQLGQLPGGVDVPGGVNGSEEEFFTLQQIGLPNPRAAGVAFSPYITDPNTNFGMLQLSDWSWFEHRVWNQPLEPLGDGSFKPREGQVLASFPGATGENGSTPSVAGDIAYIPSGRHQGDLLVADWNGGDINILKIDKETGLAIDRATNVPTQGTSDPDFVRFAGVEKTWTAVNSIGPYGFEFDPLTNDLFVSMSNSNGGPPLNNIIQIGGFPLPPGVVLLEPGDADMDLKFDQLDLVQVQIAAKYLSGLPATWGDGDWDRAPSGALDNPPPGDGVFNQLDIIVALASGVYLTGPYAAVRPKGQADDSQVSIGYDPTTGEVFVDARGGTELTSINIDSAAGIFTGNTAQNLGGSFDNDADGNIFKATFGGSFDSVSFGNVAQPALSSDFLLNDLTVVGSLDGGGDLGAVDLIYVPEPSSVRLVALGLALLILSSRHARNTGVEIVRKHRKYVAGMFAIMAVGYGISASTAMADYAAAVLADDPLGYWRFNDPDGSDTAVNNGSGGADLNGTYVDVDRTSSGPDQVGGQPVVGLGADNKAITMGPDISYVSTEASPLNSLEEFTMSGWVSADERLNARIGLWGQNDASEFGFINPTRIQMWTSGGGYLNYDYLEGDAIDIGEWFHIATVGDGEEILLYINGVSVTENSMFRGSATFDYGASDFTFSIGGGGVFDRPGRSGLSDDGNQFTGIIDEVAIWGAALSEERIQAHFNAAFVPAGGTALQAGDADQDLKFDQVDLVQVQIAAKYLTGNPATWGEGDWNGAPGGAAGNPPAGDGLFNQLDVIAALAAGTYLTGPYAAIQPGGQRGDGRTSVIYNAGTGELTVDAPMGVELTSVNIDSAAGIFTSEAAANLGGSFDNDGDGNIFKATFGGSFGSVSFGNVAQTGLSEEFVLGDLSVVGSLAGGGDLGSVDLVYVPEPASVLLMSVGLAIGLVHIRRVQR